MTFCFCQSGFNCEGFEMAIKFFNRFEDPSNLLLGPTLLGLQYWGLWQKDRIKNVIYNVIHILAVIFVISQYLELWLLRQNLEMAMRNLSVTMLSTVCVFKAGTFVFWQKSWKELIEYVSNLEKIQLSKNDKSTAKIINTYTKYSRIVTYCYWCLVTATVFTVILAPLLVFLSSPVFRESVRNGTQPYPEIMSSWFPFDRSRGFGYWVSVVCHTLICFYGGGVVATFDSNAVVIMSFFGGQLKLLSMNCSRLFGDGNEVVNYAEAVKRIEECHYHHLYLVK